MVSPASCPVSAERGCSPLISFPLISFLTYTLIIKLFWAIYFPSSPGSEAWSWVNIKNGQNHWWLYPEPDTHGRHHRRTGRLWAGQSATDAGHGVFAHDSLCGHINDECSCLIADNKIIWRNYIFQHLSLETVTNSFRVAAMWAFTFNGSFTCAHRFHTSPVPCSHPGVPSCVSSPPNLASSTELL